MITIMMRNKFMTKETKDVCYSVVIATKNAVKRPPSPNPISFDILLELGVETCEVPKMLETLKEAFKKAEKYDEFQKDKIQNFKINFMLKTINAIMINLEICRISEITKNFQWPIYIGVKAKLQTHKIPFTGLVFSTLGKLPEVDKFENLNMILKNGDQNLNKKENLNSVKGKLEKTLSYARNEMIKILEIVIKTSQDEKDSTTKSPHDDTTRKIDDKLLHKKKLVVWGIFILALVLFVINFLAVYFLIMK